MTYYRVLSCLINILFLSRRLHSGVLNFNLFLKKNNKKHGSLFSSNKNSSCQRYEVKIATKFGEKKRLQIQFVEKPG